MASASPVTPLWASWRVPLVPGRGDLAADERQEELAARLTCPAQIVNPRQPGTKAAVIGRAQPRAVEPEAAQRQRCQGVGQRPGQRAVARQVEQL